MECDRFLEKSEWDELWNLSTYAVDHMLGLPHEDKVGKKLSFELIKKLWQDCSSSVFFEHFKIADANKEVVEVVVHNNEQPGPARRMQGVKVEFSDDEKPFD